MSENFFIQKPSEAAINLMDFFRTVASLGVGAESNLPLFGDVGDIYVSDDTYTEFTWNGTSYESRLLEIGEVVYDPNTYTNYRFNAQLEIYYDYYGVQVVKTEGVNKTPPRKKPFSEDWKDEQGDDVYLPDNTYFEKRNVEIEFFIKAANEVDFNNRYSEFLKFISAETEIIYFDTYRSNGFIGHYDSHTVEKDVHKTIHFAKFKVKFEINKLCVGYDFTKKVILSIEENSKYASLPEKTYNLYLSDGGVIEGIKGTFALRNVAMDYGIITLSYIDQVNVTMFDGNIVIGLSDGANNYVIGLQNYVLGI